MGKYIQGQNRAQNYLFPVTFDDAVDAQNEVRLIDLFVDGLDLVEFWFTVQHTENGRPAYHPADLLKLYIYGYLNRVPRSCAISSRCTQN